MRVLILHPNFPGQFRDPARHLAEAGHDVLFMCETKSRKSIPGVRLLKLKSTDPGHREKVNALGPTKLARFRAGCYLDAFLQLHGNFYTPDLIISHSGWGCGWYVHHVWPDRPQISYSEWFFNQTDALALFNQEARWPVVSYKSKAHPSKQKAKPDRNAMMLYELCHASAIVAPTYWQRMQLPGHIRSRCQVIYDGIDSALFDPKPRSEADDSASLLLTYGTRGMEPMRGFPDFVEELQLCLDEFTNLTVEIAGEDQTFYSADRPPRPWPTWGSWARARLEPWLQQGRVRFIGSLPYVKYRQWLAASDVHIYLSQPYVGSWSLLEAMAAGCCLIASDVEPVRELLDQDSATMVDHRLPGWLRRSLQELLGSPGLRMKKSSAAQEISGLYHINTSRRLWQKLIRPV